MIRLTINKRRHAPRIWVCMLALCAGCQSTLDVRRSRLTPTQFRVGESQNRSETEPQLQLPQLDNPTEANKSSRGPISRMVAKRRERRQEKRATETGLSSLGALDGPGGNQAPPLEEIDERLTPERARAVHLDLGRVHETQGRFDLAVQEYREAVDQDIGRSQESRTSAAHAHRKLATALDRLGKFADSPPHYEEARRLAPEDPKVWNDSGYSAYLQGRLGEAESYLRRAQKLAPKDPQIMNNLGLVLAASAKTSEAFETFVQVGGPVAAHANLGYVLAATGQSDAARKQYQTALEQRPDSDLLKSALVQLDNHRPFDPAKVPLPPEIPAPVRPLIVDPNLAQTSGTTP